MYSLGNNTFAYVGQDNRAHGVAMSENGGERFKAHTWPKGFSADAPPRYGAFPSKDVWYVSGGTWPQQNVSENSDDYVDITHKWRLNKKTGKYEEKEISMEARAEDGNYTAVITKTTDGG
jgi:hypothetical protein